MAILEAFVYDPLISFRLLNPKMFKKRKEEEDEENPGEKKEEEPKQTMDQNEIMAKLEENQNNNLRTQIVEQVIERLQGTAKGSVLGKTYA